MNKPLAVKKQQYKIPEKTMPVFSGYKGTIL